MAPHDCRRLLLAHRSPEPTHVPAYHVAEPPGTPRAGDAPTKLPGSRIASPADPAEPGAPPSIHTAR